MIDTTSIRQALKDIYGIPDKYLVPMDSSFYVPTYDKNDHVNTWIGYRILSVKPNVRGYTGQQSYILPVQGLVRISFVGKQAEKLALQTLAFCDRKDCLEAFEAQEIQINYISREVMTYPIKEGGLNDSLCWFTDIKCQSFYRYDWEAEIWDLKPDTLPEDLGIKPKTAEKTTMGFGLTIQR